MAAAKRFSRPVVKAFDEAKIFGIKAGEASEHRYTGAWPVVVDGRLFARSWDVKRGGWFDTFLRDPLGRIQIGERELRVRAVRVRSEKLLDAIEAAYATKYVTPAAQKWVRGFRTPRRRAATIEFLPR
jgi:hypothetical protein